MTEELEIRDIRSDEYHRLGQLMVEVYASLEGFPTPEEQPKYYEMLADTGRLSEQRATDVLVAVTADGALVGGVVYYADMVMYGAGGTATQERNASGIRLLGVDPKARGLGIGRRLVQECIRAARLKGYRTLTLWTNDILLAARKIYELEGFHLVRRERHHSFGQDLVGEHWELEL